MVVARGCFFLSWNGGGSSLCLSPLAKSRNEFFRISDRKLKKSFARSATVTSFMVAEVSSKAGRLNSFGSAPDSGCSVVEDDASRRLDFLLSIFPSSIILFYDFEDINLDGENMLTKTGRINGSSCITIFSPFN